MSTPVLAYQVRQGRTRTAARVLLICGLPVLLMVGLLKDLSRTWPIILVLLACDVALCISAWPRIKRAAHGELLFSIDSDGVYLGPCAGQPERWSSIDQVVYFTAFVSTTEGTRTVRHVGVSRGGRVVKHCAADEWHFDTVRAAAAVERFGRGATLVEAPSMELPPDKVLAPIPLPSDWQARHPRTNT